MSIVQTREQAPRITGSIRPAAPRVAAPAAGGITFKDVGKVVRRRKWMISISLLIFTALTVIGTFLWNRYFPIYTSEAGIRIVPPTNTILNASQEILNEKILDRYKQTQAALVKDPSTLKDALQDPEVKKTEWFRRHNTADLKEAIQTLTDDVGVSLMPNTEFIKIGMSAATSQELEKQQLATVVNAVARSFVKQVNRTVTNRWDESSTALAKQEEKISSDLRMKREVIAKMLLSAPAESIRNQNAGTNTELQQLTQQLTQLMVLQSQAQSALASLQKQKEQGLLATNPQVLQALDMDPTLRGLTGEEINLTSTLANLQRQFGPEHPQVKSVEVRLQAMRQEAERRKKELVDSQVASMEDDRAASLTSITNQLLDVKERRDAALSSQKDTDKTLETIANLQVEIKDLETRLTQIGNKRTDLDLVMQDERTLPALLIAQADVPLQPSWPKWGVMIPMGIFLGLAFGFGLAFLLEFIDTSIKTPTDILRRIDLPLLAMIPHEEDLDEEIPDLRLACKDVHHSPINESYRELRTNLMFSGPSRERRSLLVTSASPEDGRTCVATNLAIAMANNGQKVLLLDANFRRPAIGEVFPTVGKEGLSDVLSAQKSWTQCVHPSGVANLWVMSSGPLPPNPNELLGRELTKTMLGEMVAQYDQVIVDGPPLLLFTDGTVLSTQVDGVLLVVRAGVNTYGITQRCRGILERVGAHTLGVVLNGVRTTIGGYLQKNYESFYDYQSTAKKEAQEA